MSSSVTMKALQSGCAVLSHTPGFFSTAADSWPVMGAALVCRALAMADRRVLSVHPGPTPDGGNEMFRGDTVEAEKVLTHWGVTPIRDLIRSIIAREVSLLSRHDDHCV